MKYYVYIVRCVDNTLYTGITTDVERRMEEHNTSDKLGAKYTKQRRPVALVYRAQFATRSEATKEEMRIKKLSRRKKEIMISEST